MKALVKFAKGYEGVSIRDIPVPKPLDGEVRIAIKACGICGSDIHAINDERETAIPVVLGHEFVGIVDECCGDCGNLKVGDWVTGIPAAYNCGKCEFCRRGEVTLCKTHQSVGVFKNGAMAEYMVMPAKFCFKVPADEPNKLLYAVAEPLGCTIRGVYERIVVHQGDVAVVSGPGTMGQFVAQALKSRGAYVVMVGIPVDRERLALAKNMGVDDIAENYTQLEKAVYSVNPSGADIVCECTGVAQSLANCLKIIKIHGTLLQVGLYAGEINVNFNTIFEKEITVTATNSTALSTWKITMDMLEKHKINVAPFVSMKLSLKDWEKGFEIARNKTAFKVLLLP